MATHFLIKRLVVVINLYFKMNNYLEKFISQLTENLKKEKYIQHLKAIFELADMQLISKFNKGFRFILCVIAI